MDDMLELDEVEVEGDPRAIGTALGHALRSRVRWLIDQRLASTKTFFADYGPIDVDALLAAGSQCLASARRWAPGAIAEHDALATAADVDPVRLYASANMTDVRDLLLFPRVALSSPGDEGCSALLGRTESGDVIAGQTWDLNPDDVELVVAVRRRPQHGPASYAITCAGCGALTGMNEHGLAVGTTNIKMRGARPGVAYLTVLQRLLSETTIAGAEAVLRNAPFAGAHTYWIATPEGACDYECGPEHLARRELPHGPRYTALFRTNHCLEPTFVPLEPSPPLPSSIARLEQLADRARAGPLDASSLRDLFADRARGPLSINRYPEDGEMAATNACLIALPAQRRVMACRGPADRGRWITASLGGPSDS